MLIDDQWMKGNLDRFLAPQEIVGDDLLRHVDSAMGEPQLVIAAGSVLHGFGNAASDIDLHVIVPAEVSYFPVNVYADGVHVDVNFTNADAAKELAEELFAGTGTLPAVRSRDDWKREYRLLHQLARYALGVRLSGGADWTDWQSALREHYPARVAAWWKAEALRHRIAADLLAETRPIQAAQCLCDAYLAVLNGVSVAEGELYLGAKWLGAKLRRLGRAELIDRYRRALQVPRSRAEVTGYRAVLTPLVDAAIDAWELPSDPWIALTAGEAVTTWRAKGRVLVHRAGLRGVELSEDARKVADPLPWSGRVSEVGPEQRALVDEGLVWLSVLEAKP